MYVCMYVCVLVDGRAFQALTLPESGGPARWRSLSGPGSGADSLFLYDCFWSSPGYMKKALRVEDLRLEGLVWSSLWGFIAFGSLGFTKGMPRLQDHGLPHSEGSFALRLLCGSWVFLVNVPRFCICALTMWDLSQIQLKPGAERP